MNVSDLSIVKKDESLAISKQILVIYEDGSKVLIWLCSNAEHKVPHLKLHVLNDRVNISNFTPSSELRTKLETYQSGELPDLSEFYEEIRKALK